MSQVTIRRPFGELDLSNQLGFEPDTVLHLFLGQNVNFRIVHMLSLAPWLDVFTWLRLRPLKNKLLQDQRSFDDKTYTILCITFGEGHFFTRSTPCEVVAPVPLLACVWREHPKLFVLSAIKSQTQYL
jgi:hypothetical protein